MSDQTDGTPQRQSEHDQVRAMPEGPQRDLAVYMHRYCHFPEKPECGCNDNDELMALRFHAGGSFYQDKDGKLIFFPLTDDEISCTIWPPRWPPKHDREHFPLPPEEKFSISD